jgi:SAM-dependent methyltransferase
MNNDFLAIQKRIEALSLELNRLNGDFKRLVSTGAPMTPSANLLSLENYEGRSDYFTKNLLIETDTMQAMFPRLRVSKQNLSRRDYDAFLRTALPNHETISKIRDHKKKLELFISYHLLGDLLKKVYMDAAGGGFSYAGGIPAKLSILQDMEIRDAVKKRVGNKVQFIESSLSKIPLADASVDAISTHHAFEHFQGTADIDFIKEAQRILTVNGRLVIVPIFICKEHVEITNISDFNNWTVPEDRRIFDERASLPGKKSGNFARIYDKGTFNDRVLASIDFDKFDVELIEMSLEGRMIPDPEVYKNSTISTINYPYRALVLTRLRK